jgi:hypothetical protein
MRDGVTDKIRALNDDARRHFTGCRVFITPGIAALGNEAVTAVLRRVRTYDDFTEHNDPYAEHDFGAFHHGDVQVFWKWDYFDLDLTMHSPDPSDDAITARVLTIMLADEY